MALPCPAGDLTALALTTSLVAASGAVHTRRLAPLAFGLAALSALVTFVIDVRAPATGFLCAGLSALALFRNLDLSEDRVPRRLGLRVAHVLAGFDTRRVRIVAAGIDRAAWLRAAFFGVLTLCAVERVRADAQGAMHWVAGLVWAYASFDALTAFVRAACRLFGVEVPKLHDDPVLSRSLAEFWGRRWNLIVQRMLHDHAFRPVARRAGVACGVLSAFAASALLHFWLLFRSGDVTMALSMAAFFAVHGVLVLVERALGIHRRPPWIGRIWTITMIVATLPLFLPPLLQVAFPER